MKHDHKKKIETLRKIIKEYQQYLKNHDVADVYDCGLNFFIIYKKKNENIAQLGRKRRKFPCYDIDKIIHTHRAKRDYYRDKQKKYPNHIQTYLKNIPDRLLNLKFF